MARPLTGIELVGWSPASPDEVGLVENFLGKTKIDALRMFRECGEHYTEDFAYMSSQALGYYLPPAFDCLRAEYGVASSEFCSGLLCSLHCVISYGNRPDEAVMRLIKKIARYCDSHREKFCFERKEELVDEYLRTILAA